MGNFDPDAIKASVSMSDVIGSYVTLKQSGGEFKGMCPFHDEKSPSFNVIPAKGFYHCFGCGANGDVIDFVRDFTGVSFTDACKALGGNELPNGQPVKKLAKKQQVDPYKPYKPKATRKKLTAGKPFDLINPKRDGSIWKGATPVAVHPYRDGYVVRLEIAGKKLTPMVRWCDGPKGEGWTSYAFDEPRALYGTLLPEGQVIVVEGEKAADAAAAVLQGTKSVISWCGGTNGMSKTDWSPLDGRSVIFIPDNDEPGFKAAESLSGLCSPEVIKYVIPPSDLPKGWDVADREWRSAIELLHWCRDNVGPLPISEPEPEDDVEYDEPADYEYVPEPEEVTSPHFDRPFKILGHYNGVRHYLPDSTQQLIELSPAAHTKNNLLALAPLAHWEANFPGQKGIDWDMATNAMLQLSGAAGLFNADRLRGRGAWLDAGRALVHTGQTVYVDRVPMQPENVPSKFIYQQDIDLGMSLAKPATNAEANELVHICKRLSWEAPLSATLLAGWCVIAPLCGVLPWRPHIWVTGPSGAGKSTVLKSIISVMLGDMAITVEGKTTEAGIRQQLGLDARPVLFDEAEAEDKSSTDRLKSILDFARVCSSGGMIAKGTATGSAITFSARAAFCFSSINTSVKHFADESRISQLVLHKDLLSPPEHYEKLETDIYSTLTKEYSTKMFSRAVSNMEALQANCKIFTEAANIHFRSRRIADQVGSMLAGAYLCYSIGKIDRDAALEWIKSHEWEEVTAAGAKSDADRLLSRIATHRVRVQTDHSHSEISVGEAIIYASKLNTHLEITSGACESELKRLGIKTENGIVMVANQSDPMRKLLKDTPWENSWARTLSEIVGAERTGGTIYFSPGIRSKAVSLPLELLADT